MAYCPYCGAIVKEEEQFCVSCGKALPDDLFERQQGKKKFNRWWLLPITSFLVSMIVMICVYFYTTYDNKMALKAYDEGVELALSGKYSDAKNYFEEALNRNQHLKAAIHNAQFMDIALSIQNKLAKAQELLENHSFQEALKLTKEGEELLKNYDGLVVDELLNRLINLNNEIHTKELKFKLSQKPTIQDLQLLLWQAETIQTDEAKAITEDIRNRIIDYTYTTANEILKMNQYSDAINIIENGLRFAPNSEKLLSLKTTVEKEKIAFETEQQQRIQQAMDAWEKEYEKNKHDAVEIISIKSSKDKFGDLVVEGVIKSTATVPIYSISVEYNLYNEDDELVGSNIVYTYPDTLYPDEEGKFEFTHYDIDENLTAKIIKVQWFLDSP
jgi:tetratricopeptide (TPR) repeat protein